MFQQIVVGIDGSATAQVALETAAELARGHQATLHVVSAYTAARLTPASAIASSDRLMRGEFDAVQQHATDVVKAASELVGGDVKTESHAVAGEAASALTETAERLGADLIVVGSKGMRGARRLLGSIPNTVAHQAPCAVLIVKTD